MPLTDFLLPNEQIRYQSDFNVEYAGKQYTLLVTDSRLVLYSRRGAIFKSDDVVTEAIREIQGIKYKETGMLMKSSSLIVEGRTRMELGGSPSSIKALYQRLLPFLSQGPQLTVAVGYGPSIAQVPVGMGYVQPPPQAIAPNGYVQPLAQPTSASPRFCIACGIEIASNEKFCHNCGKPQS